MKTSRIHPESGQLRRTTYLLASMVLLLYWTGCEDVWQGNRSPRITSVTSTTALLDLPYSYTVSAEDPDHDILEFVYSEIPDWLVVDSTTIQGIPDSTGTFQFRVTVMDTEGESDQATVTVAVKSNASLLQSLVATVNIDTLLQTVHDLSGNTLLRIFDPPREINSRYVTQLGNEFAAEYLEWKLASYGLLAGRFDYSETGSDVLALQQGTAFPDSVYIIGAHYDCIVQGTHIRPEDVRFAPGADDNASGVAAVLEAARILSQYTCRYSIVYALWDEEEIGLLGSIAFADHVLECDLSIAGVLDLDMIAYDSNDDGALFINGSHQGRSKRMVDKATAMIDRHDLNLTPYIFMAGSGSDSVPFYMRGFSTIHFMEDALEDFNRYDHSSDDTVDKFNTSYFHRMTKLVIATLAYLAGVEQRGSPPPSTFWFCI